MENGERFFVAGLLMVGAALVATTYSDAIQVADSGELVAVACRGGVAHPPGYPLFTLLGQAACKLPWSTPAARVGLISAFSGLTCLLLLFGIVRRFGAGLWSALGASFTLATGGLFWRYSSLAEVFALHLALSLGVVYGALRAELVAGHAPSRLRWLAVCYCLWGLSLANHHTAVFLAPLAFVVLLRPLGSSGALALRLLVSAGALVVGLTPYLRLLWVPPQVWPKWGETGTFAGLLHHVLRRDYGTFRLAADADLSPLPALRAFAQALPQQLAWVLVIAALAGGVGLWRARDGAKAPGHIAGAPAASLLFRRCLVLMPLLAGPLFFLLFNVDTAGTGRQVVERFFLLPIALLCIGVGVGLGGLEGRIRAWDPGRLGLYRGACGGVLFLAALGNYAAADVRNSYAVEDYAKNALTSVERSAVIFGTGDVRLFSMAYVQGVLGMRRDVHYVDPRMLLYRWYVDQQLQRDPAFPYRYRPRRVDSIRLIHHLLRMQRPVYLANAYSGRVRQAFAVYPVGPLFRVLSTEQRPPSFDEVVALNGRLYRAFVRRGRAPDPQLDPWSAELREPFYEPWATIAGQLHRSGQRRAAIAALARGRSWAPWHPLPSWLHPTAGEGKRR